MVKLSNAQILAVYGTAEKALRRTCAQTGWSLTDEDMADLQQSTLLKVCASYDPAKGSEPSALAWRVASNEARDFLRGRASAGAHKRDQRDQSMTGTDDDGNTVAIDIADTAPNPLEMLEMRQLDAALTVAISELTPGQASGIAGYLASDDSMSGAERIAKMRAVDALADHMKASHFVNIRREVKRGKVRKAKDESPEVIEEAIPALAKLRCLATWEYQCSQLLKARLIVAG